MERVCAAVAQGATGGRGVSREHGRDMERREEERRESGGDVDVVVDG